MTGYGEAHHHSEQASVSIELRALNNRYLKVSVRAPEPYNLLEPEFEKVVRRIIRRGTIQLTLRCVRQQGLQDFQINATALRSYILQLKSLRGELELPSSTDDALLVHALALPGVAAEPGSASFDAEREWPIFQSVLEEALSRLQTMRQEEGRAMAQEFVLYHNQIVSQLESIKERIPAVVEIYRDRLQDRVRTLLSELDIEIDRSDLIKEVSIFAERSDVTEEVVRLASHLDQFKRVLAETESPGRKLEFLTQEMFRETNTIGSKASDVVISRHVVEIKGILEKIRELVQNVE
jgi:uncharacterized protein (TIGR00255 family)